MQGGGGKKMAKFCPRSCWMTPLGQIFSLVFWKNWRYQKGISELTDFVSRRCFCLKSSYFPSFNRGRISWSKEKGFLCGNVRHLYFQFCNRKCLLNCSPNVFTKKDKKTNFKFSLFSHNSNHLTKSFWGKYQVFFAFSERTQLGLP